MPVLDITIAGEHLGVWNLDELQVQDGVALTAVSGLDLVALDRGLARLNAVAWQAVVWHLRRQKQPDLQIRDVNFKMGEIDAHTVGEPKVPSEAEAAKEATSAPDETSGSTSSDAG